MKRAPLNELIRRTAQAMAAAYAKREPGLTLPQSAMLRALVTNGPMTQQQLRAAIGMDRSTASSMLKRMASTGAVANLRVEGKTYGLSVTITPAGRAKLLKAEGALEAAEHEVLQMVPRSMRTVFKDALVGIAEGPVS